MRCTIQQDKRGELSQQNPPCMRTETWTALHSALHCIVPTVRDAPTRERRGAEMHGWGGEDAAELVLPRGYGMVTVRQPLEMVVPSRLDISLLWVWRVVELRLWWLTLDTHTAHCTTPQWLHWLHYYTLCTNDVMLAGGWIRRFGATIRLGLVPSALNWRAKGFQQKISGKPTKELDLHVMSRLAWNIHISHSRIATIT
jgi:hypothetical protein